MAEIEKRDPSLEGQGRSVPTLAKEGFKESSSDQGRSIKCKFGSKEASLIQGRFLEPRKCSR